MRILAVDVGTGTQDILLFDSEREPENYLKLVMPSPTLLVAEQVRRATAERSPLLLTGVIMGGGPSAWATENHRRAGLPVYATPDAARSFNDDLERVRHDMGIEIVGEDEAAALRDVARVELRDFHLDAIRGAFAAFGAPLEIDGLVVGVFDHGNAPSDVSDRLFRLNYLADRLAVDDRLSTFAFPADCIPPIMTRLRAVAATVQRQTDLPQVVMDTAPAAVLGALEDPRVRAEPDTLIVNVGNFHTLAFRFCEGRVAALFEHHTGFLNQVNLERWLSELAAGTITHERVFAEMGHGALIRDKRPGELHFLAVIGPRRAMLRGSCLPVYFAVPHGDQMLAGCFGMIRACADVMPAWAEAIRAGLGGVGGKGLW
ncbi:MAG: DUF1786 domain-containing protein [Anaerolineae bacterium]|nr:DUF1786 domain-containing protein [Anaerolineae bacterium]